MACRSSGICSQNPLDVGQEAEVEHFVGLVEHQHRQPAELQVALLREVEQAPWRADDDVDALLQRLDLRLVGPATVDGRHGQLALTGGEVLRRGGEVSGHLQAQFAGWDDDERARDTAQRALGVGGDALQQRHPEGQGLAHAGARLTDEVVARERKRQRQFLDSKGMFLAVFGQCAHYFVANSEFGKCRIEMGHARET